MLDIEVERTSISPKKWKSHQQSRVMTQIKYGIPAKQKMPKSPNELNIFENFLFIQ